MSNAVSALKGASFEGYVSVQDLGPRGMITIRCDLTDKALTTALKKTVGVPVPDVRKINTNDERSAAWMSPDELLVLCAYDEAHALVEALQKALAKTHALVVNVSDARAQFAIHGAGVRDVLAKLTPADVSQAAFAVGDVRRSRLAQVAGAFWLEEGDRVQIVCFRSVAQYVFDLLKSSADPASRVGYL